MIATITVTVTASIIATIPVRTTAPMLVTMPATTRAIEAAFAAAEVPSVQAAIAQNPTVISSIVELLVMIPVIIRVSTPTSQPISSINCPLKFQNTIKTAMEISMILTTVTRMK